MSKVVGASGYLVGEGERARGKERTKRERPWGWSRDAEKGVESRALWTRHEKGPRPDTDRHGKHAQVAIYSKRSRKKTTSRVVGVSGNKGCQGIGKGCRKGEGVEASRKKGKGGTRRDRSG